MKLFSAIACAVVLTAASSPALASTVLGSDITTSPIMGTNVHYRFGNAPSSIGSYGGSFWDISGQGALFQLCAELSDHDGVAPSYTVTEGLTAFGDFRDTQLTALFSNAFPLLDKAVNAYVAANGALTYNASLASEWAAIGQYSVALQTLTWVIIENQNPLIAPTDPTTPFGIADDGAGDPIATGYIKTWADQINTGAWTPTNGVKIYHAASSVDSTQDRFWMTSSAVPEPGAWAMMILGFGLAGTTIRASRQRKMLFLAA